MKANKKLVLTTAAALGVAALAAGGTIAYFTDKKEETNTFTVGDVKISLYESQLHRQNSGRMGNFPSLASDPDYCDWTVSSAVTTTAGDSTLINGSYDKARYCTPNLTATVGDANTISSVAFNHTASNRRWGFTDELISDDAEDYKKSTEEGDDHDGYFARVSKNIVPGQWIRKFTYVRNADQSSDAYVLIRYMVPTSYADNIELKIPGTPYEEDVDTTKAGIQGYFTAVTKNASTGKYEAFPVAAKDDMDNYEPYTETIENVEYKVYAAVTTQALKPTEMTFWSPINTVRLKPTVINTDTTDANYVAPATQVDVKVDAQGIQAKTFSDAIEAINNL